MMSRNFGLDLIRSIAIILVLISHSNDLAPKALSNIFQYIRFDGVLVFFVLSGYLIGKIIISKFDKPILKWNDITDFWKRRWMRTIPNYFLVLIVIIILEGLYGNLESIGFYSKYFIFSQNLVFPHPAFFPEAWSLSVEEWFYLIFPLGVALIGWCVRAISPNQRVVLIALFLILFSVFSRIFIYFQMQEINLETWDLYFRKIVVNRLDGIGVGILLAYLSIRYDKIWKAKRYLTAIIGTVVLITISIEDLYFPEKNNFYNCTLEFLLHSLAFALFFPFLTELKCSNKQLLKFITFTSVLSYSMYLINFIIVKYWILRYINYLPIDGSLYTLIKYASFWILVYSVSYILYRYFERPIMQYRDNKIPR
jgi:peptidoglycan/LPS O-acetylase OafA/YrhL